LDTFDLDIIPVSAQSTGDNIETLLKEGLDAFLPSDCVTATSTSDGGSDERKAASQLVQEGNDIWCNAHKIQLAVHDALDSKKATAPASCAAHRAIIQKAHSLVICINGHKDIHSEFSRLASAKSSDSGSVHWEVLLLDNDTRWDTWLMMLERVVYFDDVINKLYQMEALAIPEDCVLTIEELSLAYAMTLILDPIREFTKFVQNRTKITLAVVPEKIDALITRLAPNAFADKLRNAPESVRIAANTLQAELVSALKTRFADLFLGDSLALAAASIMPGYGRTAFVNFNVTPEIMAEVNENILDDVMALLPSDHPADELEVVRDSAALALRLCRVRLAKLDRDTNPLVWYPSQADLAILFAVIMMLLGIPASSADSERSFSSASFTLDIHRYRMDIETFRKEHRLRRFLVSGTDCHSQQGRGARLEKLNRLLEGFDAFSNRVVNEH
jgi:hypothetical protein